jgi:anhydro-N-acetylmuramic acid kinase
MAFCYRITGLMSGSSLDGVDLATCEFIRRGTQWDFRILAAETIPYPASWLSSLEHYELMSPGQIRDLDLELGRYYGKLLNDFHAKHGIRPALISSHGHTLQHKPQSGITFQAGCGKEIAKLTGVKVVNDFRREDVAQGGQGAPLVPVGDRILFQEYEGCLNLGGFANISYEDKEGLRRAYDIGPVNMALNWIAGLEGYAYDHNGDLARSGQVSKPLLESLNSLAYYKQEPPKSLGREWFKETFLPRLQEKNLPVPDLLASTTEHISLQLAEGIHRAGINRVLLTGGGALNLYLLERLKNHTKAGVVVPDLQLIEYKEALVFAFLGLLKMLGEINCLASVTGGLKDLSLGSVHA